MARTVETLGWELSEGLFIVKRLSEVMEPIGMGVGLCGSVLKNGTSSKDLDIILFPLSTAKTPSYAKVYDTLTTFGWHQWLNADRIHHYWRSLGSDDMKHVEGWKDPLGRRIDVFFLR